MLLDVLLLALVGFALGVFLEEQFVALASWGPFIGFTIALLYFGVLNSIVANGQTLGKKMLGIRVVDSANQSISLQRSFLRYCILGIPFFMNGAAITTELTGIPWLAIFSVVVFGGIISIVYLYLFNRLTRQTLHDLVCGTYVVNTAVDQQDITKIWKPHLIIAGVIVIASVFAPALMPRFIDDASLARMMDVQKALLNHPAVNMANVWYVQNTSLLSSSAEGGQVRYIVAQAWLKEDQVCNVELAKQLAQYVAQSELQSMDKDLIQIQLSYGYDIGIASKWNTHVYNYEPTKLVETQQVACSSA